MKRLHERDLDQWMKIASRVSAQLCETLERALIPHGDEIPPGDGIGMLLITMARFAAKYCADADAERAWEAVTNAKGIFVSAFRTEQLIRKNRRN